ncbi:MAG TPA: ABC transporter ATP-binding protein [Candidatus Hydrogenedentes bacterium]|nr:ABC transporter ATP-binding protein [Candidatus Hydrogenedentota bacterium]
MSTETTEPAIEIKNLTRKFRRKMAIDDMSLTIPTGCVYGLLGANGAGKTTLIKHLMGSYIPQQGSVRVMGLDPTKHPKDTLRRVGYLSEERLIPKWMTVAELMKFKRAFYPNWDPDFAEKLLGTFSLDPGAKIKTLSRGEAAKAELLTALAHRPDLLILDEPSFGLDVIARQEILKAIVRDVAAEGRTVFFSSHLLDEVERVSDHVAIMVNGKIVLADSLDHILESHCRMSIRFETPQDKAPVIPGAIHCTGAGHLWTVIANGEIEKVRHEVTQANAEVVDEISPSLEEVFVARTKSKLPTE